MYRESFQTTPKARSACSNPTIGFPVCRQAEAWLRSPKRDFKKGGADGMGGQRRDTSPCYRKTIHMSAVSSGRINRSNGPSDCVSPVVSPPPGRHELPETDMAIWWRAGPPS